jgi:hypothetical protein
MLLGLLILKHLASHRFPQLHRDKNYTGVNSELNGMMGEYEGMFQFISPVIFLFT